jgi:aspartate racemase
MESAPIQVEDLASSKNISQGRVSVGIIGGLGPETTSKLYLKLVRRIRKMYDCYPSILIDSISFPAILERDIIVDSRNEHKMLPILTKSVERLNIGRCNFIILPCNTLHIFMKDLRKASKAPLVSIIDETADYTKRKGYRNVGLLASGKTIESKLYESPMRKAGINVIIPDRNEQRKVSEIITNILDKKSTIKDRKTLKHIIDIMIKRGAEAIILGCTDLQLLIKGVDKIETIDTMNVLLEAVIKIYKNKTKENYLLDKGV